MTRTDVPIMSFATQSDFEGWLQDNHTDPVGIWLKLAKVGKGGRSLSYAEALEVALCFGWIDGQKKGFDDSHWLQKFTPRRARSIWSQINRDKATELIAGGRMRPSGLREVEKAKADGRWDAAYAGQRNAQVPPEMQAALDAEPQLAAFFAGMNSVNRYAYIHRFHHAKRPETRAKILDRLREGHLPYPK